MKVTFLCTYYHAHLEGVGDKKTAYLASSLPELARKFSERGHEVYAIARKTKGTPLFKIDNGVRVYRIPYVGVAGLRLLMWFFFAFFMIISINIGKRSRKIICWDWSTALPAIFASKFIRVPVICSVRNVSQSLFHKGKKRYLIYYTLERFVFNHCDMIVYSSKWVKDTVSKVIEIKTPWRILHHGVDTKKFNPNVKPSVKKPNVPVIGFFGRLDRDKGVYILVKALGKLKKDDLKFKSFFVGDGPERDGLEKMSRDLNLENEIKFFGFVPREKVPGVMAASDIVVLPSYNEGFSSVVLEAMAMGKAFVGTNVGGVPEIIENWRNGVIIHSGNFNELYKVFTRILKNKNLRNRIKKNAKYLIIKNYEWDVKINEWTNLIL